MTNTTGNHKDIQDMTKEEIASQVSKFEGLLENEDLHFDGQIFDGETLEKLDIAEVQRFVKTHKGYSNPYYNSCLVPFAKTHRRNDFQHQSGKHQRRFS